MTSVLIGVAWAITAILAAPILVFILECLIACLPGGRGRRETAPRPPAVVLIPAHNEEEGIQATLSQLVPTLGPDDWVLVVADNCSDGTAAVARSAGAMVVERQETSRRGKGYALEFGINCLRELRQSADRTTENAFGLAAAGELPRPEIVVFLDADCRVERDTVDQLARCVARCNGPVQGLNLSEAEPRGVQAVSSLGFHFKNLVRPLGLARLGMPCHLMGTGMAMPWELASRIAFAGGHLAEDMQTGVDLALEGKPATFCVSALVTSRLPTGAAAFRSQRTRWEHGHLRTSLTQIPRLLRGAVRRRDVRLLALAADLLIPPFSMLMLVWALAIGAGALLAALTGEAGPVIVLAGLGFGIGVSVLSGWFRYCRKKIPWQSMISIPGYMLRKVPIYLQFLFRRGPREWVRTARDCPAGR